MVASRRGKVAPVVGEEEMRVAGWPTKNPMARVSPPASKATLRRLFRDGTMFALCIGVWGRVRCVGMNDAYDWCSSFDLLPPCCVVVEWRKGKEDDRLSGLPGGER